MCTSYATATACQRHQLDWHVEGLVPIRARVGVCASPHLCEPEGCRGAGRASDGANHSAARCGPVLVVYAWVPSERNCKCGQKYSRVDMV